MEWIFFWIRIIKIRASLKSALRNHCNTKENPSDTTTNFIFMTSQTVFHGEGNPSFKRDEQTKFM